jgi:hypothetical protein
MVNTANLGLFAVHKIVSEYAIFKHIRRIHRKNLWIHGEDAKRLLAFSPKCANTHILNISRLLMVQHDNIFR